MGRSRETYNKKEVRNKKEKKRKEKEKKRAIRKESDKKNNLDEMIAYVDENGMITSTPPDPENKEIIDPEDIEVSIPKTTKEDEGPERTGVVSFFNESKGYGFIKDSKSNDKVFVHVSNVLEEITEGNRVSFEIGDGPKGPTAINVKPIKA